MVYFQLAALSRCLGLLSRCISPLQKCLCHAKLKPSSWLMRKFAWCEGREGPSAPSISLGKTLHFWFAFCWRAGWGRAVLVCKVIWVTSSFTQHLAIRSCWLKRPLKLLEGYTLSLTCKIILFGFFFSLFSNNNNNKMISIPLWHLMCVKKLAKAGCAGV